ncbi:MAG: hypothetical protein ACREIA_00200 [Opitutaceae bacterium]
MSEFIFYLGPDGRQKLLSQMLVRDQCFFVPNKPFPLGDYPKITRLPAGSIEEVIPNLSVLIFGPFSVEAPVVRELPSGKLARVSDNQGGPVMNLNIPGCWPLEDGKLLLSAGMLSVKSDFWDATMTRRLEVSALKQHYRKLVEKLKSELVHVADVWVAEEALGLVEGALASLRPGSVDQSVRRAIKSPSHRRRVGRTSGNQ